MKKKSFQIVDVNLDKIVGGGQTIGTLDDGCKIFVWGGLPGETVKVQITKKKSKMAEGIVAEVTKPSAERIEPLDQDSYLSTSPWQIMEFDSEQRFKSALIEEAFELHDIVLPDIISVYSDEKQYGYRNKIEFSWWWDNTAKQLDLAFFKRATHTKTPVDGSSLAMPAINKAAISIRNFLRDKNTSAYSLKTLLIRCDQSGNVVAQLYVKDENFALLTPEEISTLGLQGFEIIFSNPKSPASVITKRLQEWGITSLNDKILDVDFNYAVEGFFQINLPIYEQALNDMKKWVTPDKPTVDLYSGVGTIGLTIGGTDVTMVEINEHAFQEMERNIMSLKRREAVKAILAPTESALEHITQDSTIIVDPPRAGLHEYVINKLLETKPARIIYLSCNPVTQARDVALLSEKYGIKWHMGYNFFPRTPHIEHLVVLDLKTK
jgi:23S rRNA (uracil1939-C5)-methyltransferase